MPRHIHVHMHDAGTSEGARKAAATRKAKSGSGPNYGGRVGAVRSPAQPEASMPRLFGGGTRPEPKPGVYGKGKSAVGVLSYTHPGGTKSQPRITSHLYKEEANTALARHKARGGEGRILKNAYGYSVHRTKEGPGYKGETD
jgi:hypothetical protein